MALNSNDALLKSLVDVVTSNGQAISRFGAQIIVMTKFLDATLPHLTAAQCVEITGSFRHGIEDAMSLMDDLPLPAEYLSTLLEQTNKLLNALETGRINHQ